MFYLYVEDICDLLEVKQTYAYGVIRTINEKLEKKGFLTIRGRVPSKSLCELYGYEITETERKVKEYRTKRKRTGASSKLQTQAQ